jgi:glucose/arabinose dehydrogenase
VQCLVSVSSTRKFRSCERLRMPLGPVIAGIVLWLGISVGSPVSWSFSGKPASVTGPVQLLPAVEHNFSKPLFLTASPDDTDRLFVVEQGGRIFIVTAGQRNSSPFLDISERITSGGERGLLGLAFHPRYSSNGRFFVNYTRAQDGATVIAEYHVSSDPDKAAPKESILLVIPQPYSNHNGGMVAFGPDDLLYIGTGDGGAGGDPENRAQNREELLGKFLRIDVDGPSPYGIPPDNPFVGQQGKDEIYAVGLRNPWRFSFDRQTGKLWAGDVGQNAWEEIDIIEKGKNYGWRLLEGTHCYNPSTNCRTAPDLVDPVIEYPNKQGRCSVTGGYVYRGPRIPVLQGTYLFGDYCSGEIWGYQNGQKKLLLVSDLKIASFGEDREGELYVVGHQGSIVKIVPANEKSSD